MIKILFYIFISNYFAVLCANDILPHKLVIVANETNLRLICDKRKIWSEEARRFTFRNKEIIKVVLPELSLANKKVHFCRDAKNIYVVVVRNKLSSRKRWKRNQFNALSGYWKHYNDNMNNTNDSSTNSKVSHNIHHTNILYLSATVGSLLLIGAIFYFCAKKIYLQKKSSTEAASYYDADISTVTIYNLQRNWVPLSRFNISYADVPPSYENSIKKVHNNLVPVSNDCDMLPSYEEALLNAKT